MKKIIKFIKKKWKEHLDFKDIDGFYFCYEQDAKNTKVISDSYCIGNDGEEFTISKEQAQKENDKIVCEFCQFCRELLKKFGDSE